MKRVLEKLSGIEESVTVHIADQIREAERKGKSVVNLQTGNPDMATPPVIVQAAWDALRANLTRYAQKPGVRYQKVAAEGTGGEILGYAVGKIFRKETVFGDILDVSVLPEWPESVFPALCAKLLGRLRAEGAEAATCRYPEDEPGFERLMDLGV